MNYQATIDGTPLENLIGEALISNSVRSYTVPLQDDGSIPDVLEKDGIYSAYFAPPLNGDGEYKISVRFQAGTTRSSKTSNLIESSLGRLLPIDQNPVDGCEVSNTCPTAPVPEGFMQTEELAAPVTFTNAASFMVS